MPWNECYRVTAFGIYSLGFPRGRQHASTMSSLRDRHKTGYKWLTRLRSAGAAGLDESRVSPRVAASNHRAVEAQVLSCAANIRPGADASSGPAVGPGYGRCQAPARSPRSASSRALARRRGVAALATLRARRAQRALADGLQGARRDAGRGTLPSFDGAGRPFAFRLVDRGLRRRADADGPRQLDECSAVTACPNACCATTARPGATAATAAAARLLTVWLMRLGFGVPSRPALPSADPRQGRAHPSHHARRGAARPVREDLEDCQAAFDAWRSSTTPSGRTKPGLGRAGQPLRPQSHASFLGRCPNWSTTPETSAGCQTTARYTSRVGSGRWAKPSKAIPWRCGQRQPMASGRSIWASTSLPPSINAPIMRRGKLLPMSPNTCYPCLRSIQPCWTRP